tara:strand:- start:3 stop:170 length:168 start_codon:yes stop_codon:yes gene_type:complete
VRDSNFEDNKENLKKKLIPMEATKIPKRIIKKQFKMELLRNSLKRLIKQLLKLQK